MEVNAIQYATYTELLRKLAQQYLNLDKPYSAQLEEDWKRLTKEACRQLPSLGKYEDSWPIKVYIKRYLGNKQPSLLRKSKESSASPSKYRLRRSARASIVNRFQTEPRGTPSAPQDIRDRYRLLPSSQPVRRASSYRPRSELGEYCDLDTRTDRRATSEGQDNDGTTGDARSLHNEAEQPEDEHSDHDSMGSIDRDYISQCQATLSSAQGAMPQSPLDHPPRALASTSARRVMDHSNPELDYHEQPSPERTSSPRPALTPETNANANANAQNINTSSIAQLPSATIKEFLQSIQPSLEQLLPNFLKIGIDSEENLKALLEWNPEDREKWFDDRRLELDMTQFQLCGLLIGCNRYKSTFVS